MIEMIFLGVIGANIALIVWMTRKGMRVRINGASIMLVGIEVAIIGALLSRFGILK